MNKISTILVPFDFSEISRNTLQYAIGFVGLKHDYRILLAYVAFDGDTRMVKEAFNTIKNDVTPAFRGTIDWVVDKGPLTEAILAIQKKQTIDLVIMGTSGIGNKTDDTTNSAKLVIESDNCPVLVVPMGVKEFRVKKIGLVLGKDKIEDRSVLETLLHIARRFNAKVVVLTIQNEEGVYGYSENDQSNENLLEYYLENFYSHHSFIENDDIVQGIAEYVENNAIDMVAILPRNHAQKSEPSEGRLTKELTMHSKVPLLAID